MKVALLIPRSRRHITLIIIIKAHNTIIGWRLNGYEQFANSLEFFASFDDTFHNLRMRVGKENLQTIVLCYLI